MPEIEIGCNFVCIADPGGGSVGQGMGTVVGAPKHFGSEMETHINPSQSPTTQATETRAYSSVGDSQTRHPNIPAWDLVIDVVVGHLCLYTDARHETK